MAPSPEPHPMPDAQTAAILPIEREQFLDLPTAEIARLVRASGPKVAVFPINGTRRWFMLEGAIPEGSDPVTAYMDVTGHRHIELYQMFFDHGIDTLLTPVFGADILERGSEYVDRIGAAGLSRLATHPDFLRFYDQSRVRVHFYGDYHRYLEGSPYANLCDQFAAAQTRTHAYEGPALFYGVFANDATENIARLSVEYYRQHGSIPSRRELVTAYYGEYVEPVSFFIGFDRLSAYDMPLLATGSEDLYFTVVPSPYLTVRQFRAILYDHLYTRRAPEPEYEQLSPGDIRWLWRFYSANQDKTLGLGALRAGLWHPLPQIIWPEDQGGDA
jgi:tuberculosinol/isotuberculosinol synthase